MPTSLVNSCKKMRWVFAESEQAYVLKAPEIIIRHLSVAFKTGLVQLKSLVFPPLIIMEQLVCVFPVLPYASKQHMCRSP